MESAQTKGDHVATTRGTLEHATDNQATKPVNVKKDCEKSEEATAPSTSTNEKTLSAIPGNPANLKGVTKSATSKLPAKNQSSEQATTSSISTPTSSTPPSSFVSKSPKLANSDSGVESAGTDVSSGTIKDSSASVTTSSTPNQRSANNNQVTNGSMSESLTSTEGARTPNPENLSKTNLYIRGLPTTTTDEDLYNMCAKYGAIQSTKAIFDRATGCCRGYGFVQYTTPQAAELAVVELNKLGTLAQMARLPTSYAPHHQGYAHQHHHHHPQGNHHHHHHQTNHFNHNDHHVPYNRSNGGPSMNSSMHIHDSSGNHHNNNHADPTNLYIANLPLDMTEDDLGVLLSSYGPVISTRILRDEQNMTRGVGFARMETRDKCQEVIEKLNGKSYKGSSELLLVKFADGGNRKRPHNQNNHSHSNHHHFQHQKYNHEEHKWRDDSRGADPNSVSNYEQHGNLSHSNQMSDLSMMSPVGYHRMPQPYSPNVNTAAGYPVPPGSQTGGLQWIHPGQQWNVLPQQMMQPSGLSGPNQSAASAAYSYAHLPQLTSQMQGLQLTHHPGAHMGGYLPAHHQWPVWPQPLPHQQTAMRMGSPIHNSVGSQPPSAQHQVVTQTGPETTRPSYLGGQESAQVAQQGNVDDRATKQIQVPGSM